MCRLFSFYYIIKVNNTLQRKLFFLHLLILHQVTSILTLYLLPIRAGFNKKKQYRIYCLYLIFTKGCVIYLWWSSRYVSNFWPAHNYTSKHLRNEWKNESIQLTPAIWVIITGMRCFASSVFQRHLSTNWSTAVLLVTRFYTDSRIMSSQESV